jgi:FAD/FMN-containing dehydrogenase
MTLSRRQFTGWAAVAGASAVIGFDPRSRSWVTRAQAQARAFQKIPTLDGELLLDEESRKAAAVDLSNLHHNVPAAVLRPGSVQDVVKMVQYANRHSLKIATRGQAHSQYGQTQAEGGIVVDSRTLHAVRVIAPVIADVQAGALWAEVATTTLAKGLAPRVFPATCMTLSVGGTLNVGGLGSTSQRYGAIVDNVLELDVVTGDGRLMTCSPDRDSELFNMVLAGLGQCGIIVGARIPLIPAANHVMLQTATYANPERYIADQLQMAKEGRFDGQRGTMTRKNGGEWTFAMEVAKFFSPPGEPDSAALKSGLRFDSAAAPQRMTYQEYLFRFEARNAAVFSRKVPRVFIAAWIPASATMAYLGHVTALTPEQAGFPEAGGIETVSFYPMNSRRFTRPLFKVPAEDQFFTFWLFRTAPAGNDSALAAMIASNRDLLARMTAAGGKRYTPYGMILSRAEWQQHYGPQLWRRFSEAKRRYDPNHVLSPEPDIFGATRG